jgi:hypothetical protein
MKKLMHVLPAALVAALALTAAGFADDGGHGKGKGDVKNAKVTRTFTDLDNGSCQNKWATDTIHRTLHVHQTGAGTYQIKIRDKGSFVTIAGPSPGACNDGPNNGHTVLAGVIGRYQGQYDGVVTGGVFNPAAQCGPTCTNAQYFAAFFGPTAVFSCRAGQNPCRYNFVFEAKPKHGLIFHRWQDRGTGTTEVLKGDIANA